MGNQVIVCIGREHGSMGRKIAMELGKKRNISVYDKEIFSTLAEEHNLDEVYLNQYDEKPQNPLLTKVINSKSSSLEDVLAEKVFKYERSLVNKGDSFIVVGRCADYILKDYPNAIKIFISGDSDTKIKNLSEAENIDKREAEREILNIDKSRKFYHDHYCNTRWGDPNTYDLMVNSSILGIEGSVEVISGYIDYMLNK